MREPLGKRTDKALCEENERRAIRITRRAFEGPRRRRSQRDRFLDQQMTPGRYRSRRELRLHRRWHRNGHDVNRAQEVVKVSEGARPRRRRGSLCVAGVSAPHPDHFDARMLSGTSQVHFASPKAGADYP
jgi:hypothetical protein